MPELYWYNNNIHTLGKFACYSGKLVTVSTDINDRTFSVKIAFTCGKNDVIIYKCPPI